MDQELEAVLDQHVRPQLRGHGGGIEVLSVEDGVLRFKLTGKCSGCPAAGLTTEELIQSEVTARIPAIRQVVLVLVQETSRDLIDQARAILQNRYG